MVLTTLWRRAAILWLFAILPLAAQDKPAAVVLASRGGTQRGPKDSLDISLHPGDVLFVGDLIAAGDPNVTTLLFCPSGTVVDLPNGAVAEVAKERLKPRGPVRVSTRFLRPCELPAFKRTFEAGDYHLGASLFGGVSLAAPAALPRSEQDIATLITDLAVAERNNREQDSLTSSSTIAAYWPDEPQWQTRTFKHVEIAAAAQHPSVRQGKGSYAIVIGISQYSNPQAEQLHYAHRDAQMIYRYLTNPRGPALPANHVQMLLDTFATVTAIRDAFAAIKKAGAATVFVFIASHGVEEGHSAYIAASDSNPQDLVATAIPMSEINDDVTSKLAGVKTVFAWIDACHAGHVALNELYAPPDGHLFGLAASTPAQQSREYGALDHGHGVFSWFLNEGLNGGLATSASPTVFDLVSYIRAKVAAYTQKKQTPIDFGDIAQDATLSSLNLGNAGLALGAGATGSPGGSRDGGERGGEPGPEDALLDHENNGQKVILRYLDGDEHPVTRAQFAEAETEFAAARKIAPESLWLEAREAFCAGRIAVFDKRYGDAVPMLEKAIRLDPTDGLAYNALGVMWMERADYTRAQAAFSDAIRRIPGWAYPWHNRALAYAQAGDYSAAIRAYRRAMVLAPHYFYLPYNLGVLYQTMNRRKDAESAYLLAENNDPGRAEPHNALGTLYAAERKRAKAETEFRRALALDPGFDTARENLRKLQ